jgi:hypothetical protein
LKGIKSKKDLIINPDPQIFSKEDLGKNYEMNIDINHNNSLTIQEMLEQKKLTALNKERMAGKFKIYDILQHPLCILSLNNYRLEVTTIRI